MDFLQDDLKGFGQGFKGFPRRLPDDVVEYIIFIIDARLSDTQIRERLQAFQRTIVTLEKRFLKEYIWQKDSIKLNLLRQEGRWLLKGSTNYGDSIADEWLIVFLLRELTKEFKDAWLRIYDSDGEFLLIEAANALPRWLNPEIAEYRVWINSHRMLIIPLSKQEDPQPLEQAEALAIITETPARLQQYSKIEKEAFHRLERYPAAIAENQHHATVPLPRKVAHILHINPSYIAPAVEAFYLRDPIALRSLKSRDTCKFPPEDFVTVSVRFTKILYAQLLGQIWDAPQTYKDALAEHQEKTSTEKVDLSMKVTAGLEMLTRHELYASRKAVHEIDLLLDDLRAGDDTLPTDDEIKTWPHREDDESWLNIDFSEFEQELAGKGGGLGFGDKAAQNNLKKIVERFNTFLEDDEAGVEGADNVDPMDIDNDSNHGLRDWEDPDGSDDSDSDTDGTDDEKNADIEYEEYNKAYRAFMSLSAAEKALLVDDARELALAGEADREEDEEIQKLSEMMEAELFGHGALKITPTKKQKAVQRAAALQKGKAKVSVEEEDEEEAASDNDVDDNDDDDDDDILDVDVNLVGNMLEAFKGQAGMAGPAGNLMGLMGVRLPRDADDTLQQNRDKQSTHGTTV